MENKQVIMMFFAFQLANIAIIVKEWETIKEMWKEDKRLAARMVFFLVIPTFVILSLLKTPLD